ncbi:MAG: DUF3846 domain-containing protein [Candidatus Tyrphobacter sp.]
MGAEEAKLASNSPALAFVRKQREILDVQQQLIDVTYVDDPTNVNHRDMLALNAKMQQLQGEAISLARELEIPGVDYDLVQKPVDFRLPVPQNLSNSKRIIHILPGKPLQHLTIQDNEHDIATLLDGGVVEHVAVSQGLAILSDVDAQRKRLPFNFKFENVEIYGPAIVCRYDGKGELADLTDEDTAVFEEHQSRTR